jgi:GNAT superfamily N-acetyltransferase
MYASKDGTTLIMHSQFEYRIAAPADVAECIEIRGVTRENAISAERLASMGITEASWSESVQDGSLPGVVCIFEGRIIGYCFGERHTGEIVVLALLPKHEDKGVGRTLLRKVSSFLFGQGHRSCFSVALQIPRAGRLVFIVTSVGAQPGSSTPTGMKSLNSCRHNTAVAEHSPNRASKGTVRGRGVR